MKICKFLFILAGIFIFFGCSNDLVIYDGQNDIKSVNGFGSLTYEITLPQGLAKAELSLTSINQNTFIKFIDLLDKEDNTMSFSNVPVGYYKLSIRLYQEDHSISAKNETVYIEKNKTTILSFDLSQASFYQAPDPVQLFTVNNNGSYYLNGLSNNHIYAVAVNNTSRYIPYTDAGKIISYTLNGTKYQVAPSGRSIDSWSSSNMDRFDSQIEQGDSIPLKFDNSRAIEFNANPPPVQQDRSASRSVFYKQPVTGEKRLFWIDDFERYYSWQQKQATLAATSNHANIWILDEYFDNKSGCNTDSKITTAQAKIMAEKFDAIYRYTTPIFGYEFGGSPDSSQPGGVDGDMKIQILVYDIEGRGSAGGTIGYFWSKDFYTNEYLQTNNFNMKSNNAEMFYINSYWLDAEPDMVYSALIHEFVHLINFNEKFVNNKVNYATWYTEMLAMLGEDLIGPMIGITPNNSGHPVSMRIPYTLGLYACNPFNWSGFKSYGITFGFGAYMARNFGGAALVREIATNNKTNFDSISDALTKFNPAIGFTNVAERYYEAFISNDTFDRGMASFNKSTTSTIAGNRYTFIGFDIFAMNRVNVALSPNFISFWSSNEKGPLTYGLTQNFYLDNYSFVLLSCADWQNANGDMTVEIKKPDSEFVTMHLVVK